MEVTLVLADTNLERFDAWMKEEGSAIEWCARIENETNDYPHVLMGYTKRKYTSYYQFAAFPDVDEYLAALHDRAHNVVKIDDLEAWSWGGTQIPRLDRVGKIVECTVSAEGYSLTRLQVTFWQDEHTNFYITLLNRFHEVFQVVDFWTGSPDPAPAPASSAAGDDQVMTAGTLKPKPTGRPRDKHYDWAYAQICDGRHRDEVYQEYLAHWRKEGNDPEQEKEDARSAFDEAMIYRQKKAAGK